MNLDADMLEPPAPAQPAADPRIAVARMWLCMVDGLVQIATRVIGFIEYELEPCPDGPKGPILALRVFRDPMNAFVRVSRALHLGVALATRIQKEIAALKAGLPLGPNNLFSPTPPASAPSQHDQETPDRDQDAARERPEASRHAPSFRRNLRFKALLRGPLKDAIAAICTDLGLKPDWSLWTDNGFPPPPGGGVEDWVNFFVPEAFRAPRPRPDGAAVAGAAYEMWRRGWRPPAHLDSSPPPCRSAPQWPEQGSSP
jgi:hypothetical protein